MKQLGVFKPPPPPPPPLTDGMLVYRRVIPSTKFPDSHLYTWLERGTVRVRCLGQEHNTIQCPRPGLEPRPLNLERSSLTMRPPCLPHFQHESVPFFWLVAHFMTCFGFPLSPFLIVFLCTVIAFPQMNIWKIIYLNGGERYEFVIDRRSYTQLHISFSAVQIYDL